MGQNNRSLAIIGPMVVPIIACIQIVAYLFVINQSSLCLCRPLWFNPVPLCSLHPFGMPESAALRGRLWHADLLEDHIGHQGLSWQLAELRRARQLGHAFKLGCECQQEDHTQSGTLHDAAGFSVAIILRQVE